MNSYIPESEWQRRRTSLNHDWLKNRFLTALDAADNVLRGKIPSTSYFNHVLKNEILDWAFRAPEISWLIENFESAMSPRLLIDTSFVSSADTPTQELCRDLVHQLWLFRYPVRAWVKTARDALEQGENSFQRLAVLRQTSGPSETEVHTAFSTFRQACHAVAKAIEAFPGRVLAV